MTLLVSQPKYNLASTGGHESDRTLISYVRGVLGGDGSDGREQVARVAKTVTGVCATYENGDQSLKLAGILWTDGSSNAAADLKRRWIFSTAADQSLANEGDRATVVLPDNVSVDIVAFYARKGRRRGYASEQPIYLGASRTKQRDSTLEYFARAIAGEEIVFQVRSRSNARKVIGTQRFTLKDPGIHEIDLDLSQPN